MIYLTLAGAIILYIIGFFLGRKYEKDYIVDGVVGVLAEVNKESDEVESVTYYYSKTRYDAAIAELKENGEDYYEQ